MSGDLREIGLSAARSVAGPDAVHDAAVIESVDWTGEPIYRFSFLVDQSKSLVRSGMLRVGFIQRLVEELDKRNDTHHPHITILDEADWRRRFGANRD